MQSEWPSPRTQDIVKLLQPKIPRLPTGPSQTPLEDSCRVPRPQTRLEPLPQALSWSSSVLLHPCGRDAPGQRGQDQSCAVISRAKPSSPHLQHIWAAVSQGLKQQLSLSVGEQSRNNPARLPWPEAALRSSPVLTLPTVAVPVPSPDTALTSSKHQTRAPAPLPAASPPLPAAKPLHCTN